MLPLLQHPISPRNFVTLLLEKKFCGIRPHVSLSNYLFFVVSFLTRLRTVNRTRRVGLGEGLPLSSPTSQPPPPATHHRRPPPTSSSAPSVGSSSLLPPSALLGLHLGPAGPTLPLAFPFGLPRAVQLAEPGGYAPPENASECLEKMH